MVDFSPNSMLIFTASGPEFSLNALLIGSNDTNSHFKRFILRFCGPTKPILIDFEIFIFKSQFHEIFFQLCIEIQSIPWEVLRSIHPVGGID